MERDAGSCPRHCQSDYRNYQQRYRRDERFVRCVETGAIWLGREDEMGITVLPAFQFAPFKNLPTIPNIPTLAAGGIVTSPTLAMLGEAGPEAVVPLGLGGMGGGITINIMGPTYGLDDFEDRVAEAIRDGARRGGFEGILQTA